MSIQQNITNLLQPESFIMSVLRSGSKTEIPLIQTEPTFERVVIFSQDHSDFTSISLPYTYAFAVDILVDVRRVAVMVCAKRSMSMFYALR